MADGRDFKLYLSADGTSTGAKTELECQGDLSLSTGRNVQTVQAKNCKHTFLQDEGYSLTSSYLTERPLGAAQALLEAAEAANTDWYAWAEDQTTGGQSFAGNWRFGITSKDAPVEGVQTTNFTMSEGTGGITVTVSP